MADVPDRLEGTAAAASQRTGPVATMGMARGAGMALMVAAEPGRYVTTQQLGNRQVVGLRAGKWMGNILLTTIQSAEPRGYR